jgi:glyoxylase-like metal-dependent hydrolase (beta-lactamase superfamily II)
MEMRMFWAEKAINSVSAAGLVGALALGAVGCAQTTHAATPAGLGQTVKLAALEAHLEEPGPIKLTKVNAADWQVDLSGMLNLDHPKAEAAGLENRDEPIQIYFYVIEHPTRGLYIVDSGVARSFAERSDDMPVGALVRSFMNMDALKVHTDTKTWLAQQKQPLRGVFLTHLHLDHVMGLQDIPKTTPIYVGPEEPEDTRFLHMLGRGSTDDNLEGFGPLRELAISPDDDNAAIDIFGDGTFYGIHVPGHTTGTMAYVVRTTRGPELITGDACHTAWGWQNDVEPGYFNTDGDVAAHSLARLRALAARHPKMGVHVGHQSLPEAQRAQVAAASGATSQP